MKKIASLNPCSNGIDLIMTLTDGYLNYDDMS